MLGHGACTRVGIAVGSVPGVGVRANCVCGCVCGCACTRLGVSWDSGGILWRSVPGVGCRANCVCGCACTRVGIAVTGLDVGPTASAGRKSLRPQVPSAAGAFGRRCLRPQEPSAGPTAFSNATSCPYPMPIVRALTVSGRQRSAYVGRMPTGSLVRSSASGCSRPVFSCSCQHAGMQSA